MRRLLVPALLFVLLSACSLLGDEELHGEDTGPLLQTDQASYNADLPTDDSARVVVDIPYEVYNPTVRSLYFVGCNPPPSPILEKQVAGTWQTAYAAIELQCLSPPFVLPPGEVWRDTLHVVGFLPGQNTRPTFETEMEGTYRLRHEIYAGLTDDRLGEDLLPLKQRVSNTFEMW